MQRTNSSATNLIRLTALWLIALALLISVLILASTNKVAAQMSEVACWRFEGNLNASTQAIYNGVAFGNATTTASNSSPTGGQSLLLDGIGDYLTIGNPIPQNGSYTKTLWVYRAGANDAAEWENLFTSGDAGGAHALLIDPGATPTNSLIVYHRNGGGAEHQNTGQAIPSNQWVHIAVAYDATAQTLTTYYNGSVVDTQTNMPSLATITAADNIGAYAGMQSYFNGQLDDICVFGSALSGAEVMALANPNTATGLVVNTLSDNGMAGICTLRDAIEAANTDTAVNGCAAGSGADTITFSVNGTILFADVGFVESAITINAGNNIVVDGGSAQRLFWVESGTLTINGMTLQNGIGFADCERDFGSPAFVDCGGAAYVAEAATLLINDSLVTGNTVGLSGEGGAIYNLGLLTIQNSTLSNNSGSTATMPTDSFSRGGALANFGTANIINSTLSGNQAYDGGAVNNRGTAATLNISNSTFSGNIGTGNGGGIYNADESSGFRDVTISNSTFSGNTAPMNAGGGMINYKTVTLINSTFSGNSGSGLENLGVANISNTILANSSAGSDCANFAPGTVNLTGNNIIEDNGCGATGGSDPNLAALAAQSCSTQHMTASGLACVQTHALQTGSAAIDGGNGGVCTAAPINNLDQRGVSRAGSNAPCDIGAYETGSTPTAVKLYLPMIVTGKNTRSGIVAGAGGLSIVTIGLLGGGFRPKQNK